LVWKRLSGKWQEAREGLGSFKELRVWISAKELAVEIYRITGEGKLSKDFGLKDQMQRSSVSIAANIAEGNDRNSNNELIRFLYISKGSLSELLTLLEISKEIGYINAEVFKELELKCNNIGGMLTNLIKVRRSLVKK
jgi:four helix bundle protein